MFFSLSMLSFITRGTIDTHESGGMPLGIEQQQSDKEFEITLRRKATNVKNKPQRRGDAEKKETRMNTN